MFILKRVAEYIEGGIKRWHEIASGKTSDQMLELILTEMSGSAINSTAELLSCQVNQNLHLIYFQNHIFSGIG